jgi:hypothetical protein
LASEATREIAGLKQTGSELQGRVDLGLAAVREAIVAGDSTLAERIQGDVNNAAAALASVPALIAAKQRDLEAAEQQLDPSRNGLIDAEAAVRNTEVEIVRLTGVTPGESPLGGPANTLLESHAPAPEYSPDVRARLATAHKLETWAGGINRARAEEARRLELSINPRLAQLIEKGGR